MQAYNFIVTLIFASIISSLVEELKCVRLNSRSKGNLSKLVKRRLRSQRNRLKWSEPTTTTTEPWRTAFVDSDDEGKPRDEFYDPTVGYEPYWETGQWVMEVVKNFSRTSRWTKGRFCPYKECPEFYVKYGPICATSSIIWGLDRHFSFKNYCSMIEADFCTGLLDYTALYRGYCHSFYWFPPTIYWYSNLWIMYARSLFFEFSYWYKGWTTRTFTLYTTGTTRKGRRERKDKAGK